jgi:hypothetical protein
VADLAGERARTAVRAAAADAATVAARQALRAQHLQRGRAAAKDATRAALAPTVQDLRASVFTLLDRMLPTEPLVLGQLSGQASEAWRAFTTS